MGAGLPGRKFEEAFSVESQQDFPASHIFKLSVRLYPIPFLAKDLRNGGTAFIPMFIDSDLNRLKISVSDCSFPDGNGQHIHCISEGKKPRQQKVKKSEKNIGRENLTGKSVEKWVETKNRGLKIAKILGGSTY